MIAVVLESHTGFLFIGGSQPLCQEYAVLRTIGGLMPRMRLGEKFESKINQCNIHWRGLCKKLTRHTDEERRDLLEEQAPEEYRKLPAPENGSSKIFCWAIAGKDFTLKSPCPRCAYSYLSWDFFKDESFEDPQYLTNYLKGRIWDGNKHFYCAETVAAANIFAGQNATLVLD